jgi:predicted GNAT family acetyltransferase
VSREVLYTLALTDLIVPPPLVSGEVRCRRPVDDDIATLVDWRTAYNVTMNGLAEGPDTIAQSRRDVEHWRATRASFVLTRADERVAYSAFNATLPDVVQVGGVWTPASLRSRGYGRCVVAGSLLIARDEGATRALLFTGEDNRPAQRAYEALGFRAIGDYGLMRFDA